MTINKSQGQSFDKLGLMLTEPVFSHGQLYVALSRIRNDLNLRIQIDARYNQGPTTKHGVVTKM
jgi:ATP-dependent exoDNAse (exonuclease V) alpha subunit